MIKLIQETSVKTRRKFDETFKREALHNWLASGKSAAGAKPGSPADLHSQLEAMRWELARARAAGSIKKMLGILSEPSPNAMNGSPR